MKYQAEFRKEYFEKIKKEGYELNGQMFVQMEKDIYIEWLEAKLQNTSSNSDYAKSCDDCIYGVDGCQHEPPCTTGTGKPYYKKRDFAYSQTLGETKGV